MSSELYLCEVLHRNISKLAWTKMKLCLKIYPLIKPLKIFPYFFSANIITIFQVYQVSRNLCVCVCIWGEIVVYKVQLNTLRCFKWMKVQLDTRKEDLREKSVSSFVFCKISPPSAFQCTTATYRSIKDFHFSVCPRWYLRSRQGNIYKEKPDFMLKP